MTLLGGFWTLNYGKRFGKSGRSDQSLMVKADLWTLELSRAVGRVEVEVGMEEFVASSGRPAFHQNETSS